MTISRLAHYSVRTTDLERSKQFFIDLLGLREGYRPPFNFPGAWLYLGEDEADFGVVHIIGIDSDDPSGLHAYLGDKDPASLVGGGAIDHIAFLATDLAAMHGRLKRLGLDYHERTVPSLGLHQLFVIDPSGVTLELNYPAEEASALQG